MEPNFWESEENSMIYTDQRPVCDLCNHAQDITIEIKGGKQACFGPCFRNAFDLFLDENPEDEYLWVRLIQFKEKK